MAWVLISIYSLTFFTKINSSVQNKTFLFFIRNCQYSIMIQYFAYPKHIILYSFVTIHGYSKHHAKNHPAMPSGAAKAAAFVFLMMFRTAYTLISENNQPLMCKHNKFDYFLKSAVNSNILFYILPTLLCISVNGKQWFSRLYFSICQQADFLVIF